MNETHERSTFERVPGSWREERQGDGPGDGRAADACRDLRAEIPFVVFGTAALLLGVTRRRWGAAASGLAAVAVAMAVMAARQAKAGSPAAPHETEQRIDEEVEASFPASDPPSWSGGGATST